MEESEEFAFHFHIEPEKSNESLLIEIFLPINVDQPNRIEHVCSNETFSQWNFFKQFSKNVFQWNFHRLMKIFELREDEGNVTIPSVSERLNITCFQNGSNEYCFDEKCRSRFSIDHQNPLESFSSSQSDFDRSISQLRLVTLSFYPFISPPQSSIDYQCFWNLCNHPQRIDQIQMFISPSYHQQLHSIIPNLIHHITTITMRGEVLINQSIPLQNRSHFLPSTVVLIISFFSLME